MKFGLMFFAASEESLGADKYRLVRDSARFADREGFSSVWVPERHFTGFGGLYPNPAVLHAGLATCTSRIRLNAGSVVAPLHHPIRIAEEWSVVDNLSNGRVGLSFASGWNPDDFVFFPERYESRHQQVFDTMEAVRRLWRGEAFAGTNGVGKPASVTMFPKPVQAELPVWMTVAGNPRNFERAGASGAHLLTHLLDQDEAVLASRIALYRNARAAAGFDPATGIVSLMIHTLVGANEEVVREQARQPYCDYIKANIGLFKGLAQSRGRDADLTSLSPADLDEFVNFLYDRFAASRGLIGTPDSCGPLVSRLEQIGVTELACLLDFGPQVDLILGSLPDLARLKDLHSTSQTPEPILVEAAEPFDRPSILQRCTEVMSGDEFHRVLGRHGIQIDTERQPVRTVWRRDGEALAQLFLETTGNGYHVHPASLDACGRILAAALPGLGRDTDVSYVPTGFDACNLPGALTGAVWVHARITGQSGAAPSVRPSVTGDVGVYDEAGRVLARLDGLRFTPTERRVTPPDAGHLLYERTWRVAPDTPADAIDATGRWLVIADHGGVGTELVRRLEDAGGECVSADGDEALRGIVYLCGLDAMTGADATTAALDHDVAHTLRGALAVAQSAGSTPVWLVTRGAVPAGHEAHALNVSQAPLWGFGRALAVERPGGLGALVDLDASVPAGEAARQLMQVLTGDQGEDMVAFRSGARYVPRLGRVEPEAAPSSPLAFDAEDTILVTGGVGGLGLRLTEWLAARGVRHILLCSRRAPVPSVEAHLERLRASGVDVRVLMADVSDEVAFEQQLDIAAATQPPLTGVFHLAGVLDDGQLDGQSWDRFAGVLAAKVGGAWNLHRITRGKALKHFVLFSSVASMLPAPGQSNYAAANAFLDALAHLRRSEGLPALSVNWGPWSEAGHALTDYGGRAHERLASIGIGAISPDEGLGVLESLLQEGRTQTAVVSVDWPQFIRADPAAGRLGFLAGMVAQAAGAPPGRRRGPSALVDAIGKLPADERRPYLMSYLSDMVIAALKLRTDEPIDGRQRLFDIGLDSIMALELKDRLERALGVTLSATLLFVRPTLDALSDFILTEIISRGAAPAAAPPSLVDAVPSEPASPSMSEEHLTRLLLREIDASRGV